jgi:hypothetical protein
LLYDQGFTISGARNRLQELVQTDRQVQNGSSNAIESGYAASMTGALNGVSAETFSAADIEFAEAGAHSATLHNELVAIRALLTL